MKRRVAMVVVVMLTSSPVAGSPPFPTAARPDPAAATAAPPLRAGLSPPAVARPSAARPALDLTAALDPAHRRIGGTARWLIPNVSAVPLREVLLWLYPNRLAERPEALGDVNFHWLYPHGFSAAALRIQAIRVGNNPVPFTVGPSPAGRDTIARVALPAALPVGGTVAVDVDFATDLPDRLGGFGCAGSQCRMMGGFYPFPLHLADSGFEITAAPDRIDYHARVTTPPGTSTLLGDVFGVGGSPGLVATASHAAHVTLVADRGLRPDDVTVPGGMSARFFHQGIRPPSSRDEVLPYVREDRAGLVLDAARTALDYLTETGLPAARADVARPLVLIEAPLRHELVQVHGDVILVSDRLFEIFPLERLRKFHRLELMRAVFVAVFTRALADIEPDSDVDLAAEVLSLHFIELFTVRAFQQVEYARDLLRPLSFIPAVDQLIYAPLVAASSSYFGDPDDRDPIRDDVRRFSHRRSGGRLLHAKLLDLLGPRRMEQLAHLMLHQQVPLREAAAQVWGNPLDWFWRQWLGPVPPRVNYRLAAVHSRPLSVPTRGAARAAGTAAAATGSPGVHVEIDLRREGDQPIEPVEVRVTDGAQVAHELVWNEPGDRHQFQLELPAGLASVELDPRHRLVESAVGSLDPADDPLTDNRTPRAWRFIYSGAAALVDVTALSLSFAAAVRVKPVHDLRNSIVLLAHHSPSTDLGIESAYTRLFGRQADRNRLTSAFGVSLSASLLNRDFGVSSGETLHPRWRLTGSLFTEHDDRDYLIDPWRAVGMTADVTYSLTGLDSGEQLSQFGTGIELLRLVELLPGHVLALDGQAGATFGDLRVRSQLAHIGGPTGLRGYAPGELFGRGRALARIELRDRYLSDLDWNLGHFTTIRGLGGNLFFEAGLVTSCDDLTVARGGLFYDVGYSFRVLHDAFGVYQQLLSVDVAIPLNRHDRLCKGQHSLDGTGNASMDPGTPLRRPPFVVLISFLPNF